MERVPAIFGERSTTDDRLAFPETIRLGLNSEEPWCITSTEMVPAKRNPSLMELYIKVDFSEGATFDCFR
jgi:hypothetical protein